MTKQKVKSVICFLNSNRRFIPGFAEKAAPLTDLTSKSAPDKVVWKQEQQTAFDSFKQTIISYPVPRERQYKTIEKECLVIVRAVSVLREYLEGREFIIETDHFPLQWLNKMKGKNQRLSRWSLL